MHGWDLDAYASRARAFGWQAIEIDGHDVDEIDAALAQAVATTGRPTVIVARTEKGHGVRAVANQNGAHGKPVDRSKRRHRRARRPARLRLSLCQAGGSKGSRIGSRRAGS